MRNRVRKLAEAVLTAVIMTVTVSGVAPGIIESEATENAVTDTASSDDIATETLLADIMEANETDYLIEKYGNFSVNMIYCDENGEDYSSEYFYVDEEQFVVEDSDSNVFVLTDDGVYGFEKDTNLPYRGLFMDGVFEEFRAEQREDLIVGFDEGETVVSSDEENGTLTLVTEIDKALAEQMGMDVSDWSEDDVFAASHELDAESLEVQAIYERIQHSDGTSVDASRMIVNYGVEPYQASEDLMRELDNEDSRTVTLIADPGTEQEKTYSQTVGKGCSVSLYTADGYSALYTDEGCTQELEETDTESDITIYAAYGKK